MYCSGAKERWRPQVQTIVIDINRLTLCIPSLIIKETHVVYTDMLA